MICSKCGAQNMDGVTFCGNCGSHMQPQEPPQSSEAPSQQAVQSQSPQSTEAPSQQVVQSQATQQTYQQQPPYGGGQPGGGYTSGAYTTPPGGPSNGGMVPPKNYLTESIIVTVVSFLCCCSPVSIILGIIAIVKANNVNQDFERGNITEAVNNSEAAKKLTIWAAVIAVVFCIVWNIICFAIWGATFREAFLEGYYGMS